MKLACAALLLVSFAGRAYAQHDHAQESPSATAKPAAVVDESLPAGEEQAKAALARSPRHGEWADVKGKDGAAIRTWIVYPERKDKAPVVIVIHEIFGPSDWIRAVADQLAREGFIAVAPDLLSGKGPAEAAPMRSAGGTT